MIKELKGVSCYPLEYQPPRKKNICTSRSFGMEVKSLYELKEAVASYSTMCAMKLRKENSLAASLLVFIKTNPFKDLNHQYSVCQKAVFDVPTNDSVDITKKVIGAFAKDVQARV